MFYVSAIDILYFVILQSTIDIECLTFGDRHSTFGIQGSTLNIPLLYYAPNFPNSWNIRLLESWSHYQPRWLGRYEPEVNTWRGPGVTCVLIRGWHMSCSIRHKKYMNHPYLGDTWHLSSRSKSLWMKSVNHVSPRHRAFYLISNLIVKVFPHRSVDPRLMLLHNSRIQILPTPHIVNPPKSQVFRLLNLVPCFLYLSTVEIHFSIHDFYIFHTLKTLGQVPLVYQVSGL